MVNLEQDFKSSTFGLNYVTFSMDGLKAKDKFRVWFTWPSHYKPNKVNSELMF